MNVHTAANPPGEIRGQLMGQPATDTSATPVGRATPVGVLLMLAVVGLISATLVVRRLARR